VPSNTETLARGEPRGEDLAGPGWVNRRLQVGDVAMFVRSIGSGPPLVLLLGQLQVREVARTRLPASGRCGRSWR
jgi:hypothetical protein